MRRRRLLSGAAALSAVQFGLSTAVRAQTKKILFGYTGVTDFATVFLAVEQGFFAKRMLEVEPKFIPLNSTIPAAVQSGSLQIGGPASTVFLQAVDGGLDQVVVAGGGITSKAQTGWGLVARAGSGIRTASDCAGKKIGVPGLGALLHVTFRAWLKQSGVEYRSVIFVEASFPQQNDLLRGASVDAVVTAEPFLSRVTDTGTGYVASYYSTFLPENQVTIVHVSRRDWAEANPTAARSFREALQEAAAFMRNPRNEGQVRAAIEKYIKLPPDVLAKAKIITPGPVVTEAQLGYWVDVMRDQEMLSTELNVRRLIFS